jgi:hypothetical protein
MCVLAGYNQSHIALRSAAFEENDEICEIEVYQQFSYHVNLEILCMPDCLGLLHG